MKKLLSLLFAGAMLASAAGATYADSYGSDWNVSADDLHDDVNTALTATGADALSALPSTGVESNNGFVYSTTYGAGSVTIYVSGGKGKPYAIDATLNTSKATAAQASQYGAVCGAMMKVLTPEVSVDSVNTAVKLNSTVPAATGDNLLAYYHNHVLLTNEIQSGSVCFSAIRYPDDLSGIGLVVNDHFLALDTAPRIVNSRTLVPLRGIFEELGADVTWDQATQTAAITHDGKVVKVPIGSKTATVDGNQVTLDTPAQLSAPSGPARTLVPVRFIAESLGAQVGWLNSPQTVIISNQ